MPAPSAAELYEIARRALPRFLFEKTGNREILWGAAKIFERVGNFVDERALQTLIKNASDPWLTLHARDRGTFPQSGESEPTLRTRLRKIADVATVPALKAAIDDVLAAAGQDLLLATSAIVELASSGSFVGQAAVSQGFRTGCIRPQRIIVILPFGTSPATASGVAEQLRKKHAAGFPFDIEVRQIP